LGTDDQKSNNNSLNQKDSSSTQKNDSIIFPPTLENFTTLKFRGSDTLCISKLVRDLQIEGYSSDRYLIRVNGKNTKTRKIESIVGNNVTAIVDGYIRTLVSKNILSGKEFDVGGSNATKELIAADSIEFFIERSLYKELIQKANLTYLAFYKPGLEVSESLLKKLFEAEHIDSAIAIAKHLDSIISVEILTKYFENHDFTTDKRELICEAFRSLEKTCAHNDYFSFVTVLNLGDFISDNYKSPEYVNPVIYCIESLGYVSAHSERSKGYVRNFLSILLMENMEFLHKHIVWAALSTLKTSLNKDINVSEIRRRVEENFPGDHILLQLTIDMDRKLKLFKGIL